MTIFAVAQLSFKDRRAYQRYQDHFMDVLKEFGGRLLAADEHPTVIEGDWNREKVVIISFHDEEQFLRWSNSSQYRKISIDRRAGADAVILLVKGI